MKKACGRCRPVGKRIQVQFGVCHGHIRNSVRFWQHAHSIELSPFGKRQWVKSRRRQWHRLNVGLDAQVSLTAAPVSPIVNLAPNHKDLYWPHVRQMVWYAFTKHPISWICRNGRSLMTYHVRRRCAAWHMESVDVSFAFANDCGRQRWSATNNR